MFDTGQTLLRRAAPWAGRLAGLGLLAALLLALGSAARAPGPAATGAAPPAAEYVVIRHVLLAGNPISRPDHEDPGAVSAQYRVNQHRWGPGSMPVSVAFNPEGAPAGIDAAPLLQDAVLQWNGVSPGAFTFEWVGASSGGTGSCGTAVERDGVNTVKFVDDLAFGVLGQTCTVWPVSGGSSAPLTEFDMELSSKVQWSIAETTPASHYDLRSTILHEVGHAAGLGHTDDESSVMYASLKAGQQRRTLTEDDAAGLAAAYRRILLQSVARD